MRYHISIFTLLFLVVHTTFAQQKSYIQENKRNTSSTKKRVKEYVYPSNVIKLNIPAILVKTFGVQYEYKLSNRASAAIGIIFRPKSSFSLYKLMADSAASFGIGAETAQMYRTAKMSTFMLTPEFRYYFKKRAPKGLYLAPFIRFKRESNSFNYFFQETSQVPSITKSATCIIRDNTLGAGILFGYHLVSKKKFTIDFWLAGPWYGFTGNKVSSQFNTSNLNQFDKAVIESKLETITSYEHFKWTSKGFEANKTNSGLGFRMFGINLGYNF